MMKFFVSSDIHSYYTAFKTALDKAGFDPKNKDHWLIICGDVFDRGDESVEILQFIMSLERKILVKGNHDILLEELCMREFPYSHDKSNGTVKTVISFGDFDGRNFDECCRMTWNKLARYRELLVNYFETKNYIFVHSWIPTVKEEWPHPADKWITLTKDRYMEDWRNAADVEWEEAMWGNPFKLADQNLNKTGKTIVFGHWHCSTGHKMLGNCEDEFEDAIWEPCYFKNTIGIDRCTAYTGEVNVLILEDEILEGEYGLK
jgi:serine/threonine protein phosphatase 1